MIMRDNGEAHSIRTWSKITGIGEMTIYGRLRQGWDVEKALFTPVQQHGVNRAKLSLEVDGEKRTIKEWSEITGISYSTLYGRYKLGWSAKDIITKPLNCGGNNCFDCEYEDCIRE